MKVDFLGPQLAGVLACTIWASAVVVVDSLAQALGPNTALGAQCLLGGVLLLAWHCARKEHRRLLSHPRTYYLCAGFGWALHVSFLFLAIGTASSAAQLVVVGLINYLWPALTVVLSIPILGRSFSRLLLPGLCLAISGIALAKCETLGWQSFSASDANLVNPLAYLFALVGAVGWSAYSNYSKKYGNPRASSAVSIFMLATAVPFLLIGRVLGEQGTFDPKTILLMLVWSIATTTAVAFWDHGIRYGGVVTLSCVAMLIPIASTILTCLVKGVPISSAIIFASTMVTAGALLCRASELRLVAGLRGHNFDSLPVRQCN